MINRPAHGTSLSYSAPGSASEDPPRTAASFAAVASRPFGLIGTRYQIINELGQGAMGSVYRVLDRLTGRVVTLKRLHVTDARSGDSVDAGSSESRRESRRSLAQEFRLLASLRHPNIISVLDYGFDEERQPYFTMDLEENARTIIEAGSEEALAVQVELLAQTLRALVYLHQQRIIHRDLKPENILVVGDQVKLLDFGLSVYRDTAGTRDVGWAGTLAYMAPEVLGGEPPSERSDLYAVGMIAYELFVGGYPFNQDDHHVLCREIVSTSLPRPADAVDPRLRPVLERLLCKRPEDRHGDASEVITALAGALDQPLAVETVATRESFLQTAPLVGRGKELATLLDAVFEARRGNGSTWLVGGESGVGKSRLLDEVRTWVLVEAIFVVRGHAVSQGGGPHHLWRDVLSNLVLRIELNDTEAELLKAIVPDISTLLGREIGDAPVVDSEAARSRLLFAVEEVFRMQPGPVLVILEDLQWAGSESLEMLAWLAQSAESLPLLLLGSFRDDETPKLPDAVKGANVLTLRRLDRAEIVTLGESMIGAAARRPDLIALLERETEGIPFFIVEVVRALAESAGRLAQVAGSALPQRVISGGMRRVIRRRLNRVPSDALPPLKTAAIIGREIDVPLMQAVHPQIVIDQWAAACAREAVLDLRDQQWRFAHDKLREQLLDDLSLPSRRALHRTVAEAIERTYPDRAEYVTALAHHWRQAGEPARETTYAHQAGVLALRSGACREAIVHLSRTLELLRMIGVPAQAREPGVTATPAVRSRVSWRSLLLDPNARVDPESPEFRLGMVESGLSEANYCLGELKNCREHAERALAHFGQYVPSGKLAWPMAALAQAALRCTQTLCKVRARDMERTRRVASEITRVQLRLTDTFFYSLQLVPILWSSLRAVNQCEPAGPSPELARSYIVIALLAGAVPARRLADAWSRRALEIAESAGTERDVAWTLSRTAVHQLGTCRWDDADAGLARAAAIAERVGDLRLREECRGQAAVLALYSGQFDQGLALFRDAHQLSRRSGNRQIECWSIMGQANIFLRLGRTEEALALYGAAIEQLDENAMKTEAIWGFGMLALARLRAGDPQGAYEMADRALWYVRTTKPVAYWTQQGTAATAEVLVSLRECGWGPSRGFMPILIARARDAVAGLRRFARHLPLGRPHACLWHGLNEWLSGRQRRAMRLWRRTIDVAEQLRTPYERGRAHLEIGRHLPAEAQGRRHHLDQAVEIFATLGCAVDLARARAELARPGEARAGVGCP